MARNIYDTGGARWGQRRGHESPFGEVWPLCHANFPFPAGILMGMIKHEICKGDQYPLTVFMLLLTRKTDSSIETQIFLKLTSNFSKFQLKPECFQCPLPCHKCFAFTTLTATYHLCQGFRLLAPPPPTREFGLCHPNPGPTPFMTPNMEANRGLKVAMPC